MSRSEQKWSCYRSSSEMVVVGLGAFYLFPVEQLVLVEWKRRLHHRAYCEIELHEQKPEEVHESINANLKQTELIEPSSEYRLVQRSARYPQCSKRLATIARNATRWQKIIPSFVTVYSRLWCKLRLVLPTVSCIYVHSEYFVDEPGLHFIDMRQDYRRIRIRLKRFWKARIAQIRISDLLIEPRIFRKQDRSDDNYATCCAPRSDKMQQIKKGPCFMGIVAPRSHQVFRNRFNLRFIHNVKISNVIHSRVSRCRLRRINLIFCRR
ncbi:hypothetical protein ANN_23817 [Periplaneta americana]|uniref:Uncharacterized protein n=1 Tax=Periplaneta americana TaxID=6978 RepID=A0ABQ8SM40_PERAM|nr:hypothetical protein ANN_23817 [Periplaneta americana]